MNALQHVFSVFQAMSLFLTIKVISIILELSKWKRKKQGCLRRAYSLITNPSEASCRNGLQLQGLCLNAIG